MKPQPPDKVGPLVAERVFRARGENEYSLELLPAGISLYVNRVRRSSHELWGELTVSLTNGHFPKARTVGSGVLSSADMNFSSITARNSRAKHLKERCGPEGDKLDWTGFIEELSIKAIETERTGEAAIVLADFPRPEGGDDDAWTFDGFRLLKRHPTVLFGNGASGKSYYAMWLAGNLAKAGINVLYCDWELAGDDHRNRLERLFQPVPRNVHYVRCNHPLRDQVDRFQRLLKHHQCQFIVCDSVGPASRAPSGRYFDGDLGQEYFGLMRRFGIGSLHIAHPPKNTDDEKQATIIGSAFFGYLARSIWYIQAAENNPKGELAMGFYHHKLTTGAKTEPCAYKLIFEADRTYVKPTDLKANEELSAKLPLLERILQKLAPGSLTIKELSTFLDVPQNSIRKTITRHGSKFVKLDKNTVGLALREERF